MEDCNRWCMVIWRFYTDPYDDTRALRYELRKYVDLHTIEEVVHNVMWDVYHTDIYNSETMANAAANNAKYYGSMSFKVNPISIHRRWSARSRPFPITKNLGFATYISLYSYRSHAQLYEMLTRAQGHLQATVLKYGLRVLVRYGDLSDVIADLMAAMASPGAPAIDYFDD